jgi:NADH-quinone oxidoreductase subunit H
MNLLIFVNTILDCLLYLLVIIILNLLPIIISIAFFTLAERKIMAAIQRRRGPNITGYWGLLQPFADGVKILIKEVIVPSQTSRFLFLLSPCITFILSLINWAILPFNYAEKIADLSFGLLYIYAISSLSVYGIILAGWVSNSKYPFLGALRSAAQMISYEVSIGLIFVTLAYCAHSLNLTDIVYAQEVSHFFIITLFPLSIIFLISSVAETNRAPFDLPEAEAEIVAGYNIEYSSMVFALFFLGEYGNILLMSSVFSLLFLGGWLPLFSILPISPTFWFLLKTVGICYIFVIIRATLPRYRYDQLMDICWQLFLPFNLIYLLSIVIYNLI